MTAEQIEAQDRIISIQQRKLRELQDAANALLVCLSGLEDLPAMEASVARLSALLPKTEDSVEYSPNSHYPADGKLFSWIRDPDRGRANLVFTSGRDRQIAYAVEDLLAGIGQ